MIASKLTVRDDRGIGVVKQVSFELRSGEILAVAGVKGNGQSELARAIINLEEHIEGSLTLEGRELI